MCKQQFYQIGALYNNSLSVHFYTPNNHYDMTVLMKNPFDHKLLYNTISGSVAILVESKIGFEL